ncbi:MULTISPECIES: DUF3556 domain-containing protein [Microbacterium]|uniref:DUF3556 domain-containing protein n=1 Tax=Microbacterium TaxID=33882 RepID=UPI0027805A85|nr:MULTISPECIES: DUF3556 domain-containing protein [Microbacterium]MDQ1075862.1 putative membrane protein YkgB [Microbacterium sp. SORGH_AS_0969]MDQ1116107.1 putative membrane protein YkgB [Microbacterium testaceum]
MGFKTGDFPPVDLSTFLHQPLRERVKALGLHWVEYGFGSPRMIAATYLVKIAVLWLLIGSIIITATSGVGWFWQVDQWWNQPIVYQKAIIWTMLLEAIGLAGSWGPTAGKFKPMTGGIQFWARPGTIRLRPWAWVPGTAGDTRTIFDVVVYLGFLAALATALVLPGTVTPALAAALPGNTSGLVQTAPVIVAIALLVIVGVRDKTIAVASRIEQYLPALVFFSVLSFVDMIIALKLLIVAVWVCAGVSKFGKHFVNVIPPMLSNTPFWPPRWLKRALYRDFPRDVRPSKLAHFMAHAMGTTVEIAVPLVLLFSQNFWVTLAAVVLIVGFHLFIFSTFPLAVPLEWNTLFCYAAVFLFLGFPAQSGYAVTDFSNGWLLAGIVAALLFFPVLGNIRPDKVSFLPSMRQYAGNWASALWTFTPGAEKKLDAVIRPTKNQVDQLVQLGYAPEVAEITMQQTLAWRSMHSQGRGLFSVLYRALPDIETRTIREGEFACNSVIGFNFGDGHLHDESLIRALQSRCRFEPGEFVVVWVESQAIHANYQEYKVIDAARGVIERGRWRVADAVAAQPWLADGPIPLERSWRADATGPVTEATNSVRTVSRRRGERVPK